METVITFRAASAHGNITAMLDQLGAALERRGFKVACIDLRQAGWEAAVFTLLSAGEACLAVTVAGIGLDLRRNADNIYARSRVPLVSLYLDPVLHYWDQVSLDLPRRVITTTSPDDLDFCARHGRPVALLPHSAPILEPKAWAERDIPVFLAASLAAPPEMLRAGWRQHGVEVEQRLNQMLDAHLAAPDRPLCTVIAEILGQSRPLELHPYFATLDVFLRAHSRQRTVEAVLDQPVTVVGSGWDSLAGRKGRAVFLGPRPVKDVIGMTGRSKICLNVCTAYHGSHERLFTALSAASVALTSWSGFPADGPLRQVLTIGRPYGADMAEQVACLLANDATAQDQAGRGREVFLAGETWDHRAGRILELAGLSPPPG